MIDVKGYQFDRKIYESSQTLIYGGRRVKDDRPVMAKLLKTEYSTPAALERLEYEYEVAKRLNVPGVVKPYALVDVGHSRAIIMEDFGAISLREYLRGLDSPPLTPPTGGIEGGRSNIQECLEIALTITGIIGDLHQQQVIHKDIKPHNILINPDTKEVKLTDFSLAAQVQRETQAAVSPETLEGSLAYMSPEQTGRMNRALDYRTDFYSLGVTFYQMFSGRLPFETSDLLELVHSHIARQPLPPDEINPEIPAALVRIILKLLAKNPEERYQTAYGLQADLGRCLARYQARGNLEHFEPGQQDISDRFRIPEKLYGREKEVATLIAAFDRIAAGENGQSKIENPKSKIEMVLITGPAGIGKTSLIHEIHKPLVAQKGYFIGGKFDQLNRNVAYSAIAQAFQNLVKQILGQSEERIHHWQEKLNSALGPNGQIIIDVIPEIELIIGPQPPAQELGPTEAQNRFRLVFQSFVAVLARADHPLALFLDDLQWADAASLYLLDSLLSSRDIEHLFLMGAYRDNEVHQAHPLALALAELEKKEVNITKIQLEPLKPGHLTGLIADTLRCPAKRAQPLAGLIYQKTEGNPFFFTELFKNLYQEKYLSFLYHERRWVWDMEKIKRVEVSDNVVDFMVERLRALPAETQNSLYLAACIGNSFNLQTLAMIEEQSPAITAKSLWAAIWPEIIVPASDDFRFVHAPTSYLEKSPSAQVATLDLRYQFQHDRVQQAAYALIDSEQREAIHLRIGRLLLQNLTEAEQELRIFDIANQFNAGWSLLKSDSERLSLAELNLKAGQKAKESAAYISAAQYLSRGLACLPPESWQTHYKLTFKLYLTLIETEFLNTHFEQALALAETVLQQIADPLDQALVYELQTVMVHAIQLQPHTAIELGLKALTLLGVELAETVPDLRPEDLDKLPAMTDPHKLAAMRVAANLIPAIFTTNPELFVKLIMTMIRLSSQYGHSAPAILGYAYYGAVLCAAFGDIEQGYRYGRLAVQFLEQSEARSMKAKVLFAFNCFVRLWKEHLRNSTTALIDITKIALENGDLEFAGYGATTSGMYHFFVGEPLGLLEQRLEQHIALTQNLKHETGLMLLHVYRQMVLNLRRESHPLVNTTLNTEERLPQLQEGNLEAHIFHNYITRMVVGSLFQAWEQVVEDGQVTAPYVALQAGTVIQVEYVFYYSLALLAQYPHVDPGQQADYLNQVVAQQKQMETWAKHAPMNFQHKYDLIAAEKARVLGDKLQAMTLYDRAVQAAGAQGYLHIEALANERAALFYLAQGQEKVAGVYMKEAHYLYTRWGATAKVQHLEATYPTLLRPQQQPARLTAKLPLTTTSSSTSRLDAPDMAAIIKASQAISGEIHLDKLLEIMMKIIIENAGAQKGFLLLNQDKTLHIEAMINDDDKITVLQSIPIDDSQALATTVARYVARTGENVVLQHATQAGLFTQDPYILQYQPKSILCIPLRNQDQISGILYLENNLTPNAFTADRLEVLYILAAQAAISLENALLYHKLDQEIITRRQTEEQLKDSLAEKEVLLKEIHHRVKNNMQIISSLLDLQADNLNDEATRQIFKESQNRIRSMALIHERLYQSETLARINFAEYVEGLINYLYRIYTIEGVRLSVNIAPIFLTIEQAIPCGLIINELVSNAMKHAFPMDAAETDEIYVEMLATNRQQPGGDNELTLLVRDTGVGFPPGIDFRRTQSLGLMLVMTLVRQLEGTIELVSRGGTEFRITFTNNWSST